MKKKTFIGQETTILWQDIKNTLVTFSLKLFKIFSYFGVFFTLLNMFMCWLLKLENTFKQTVKFVSWNNFFDCKSFTCTSLKYISLWPSYQFFFNK